MLDFVAWRRLWLSMQFRILMAGALVILVFVALAVGILVHVFAVTIERGVRDRLEASLYGAMGVAEVIQGHLQMPEALPEARFNQLNSGQYAWVSTKKGVKDVVVWRSASTLGKGDLPIPDGLSLGSFVWQTQRLADEAIWVLSFESSWALGDANAQGKYVFSLAQQKAPFIAQVRQFQYQLVMSFVALGVVLCVLQVWLLRHGLRPLVRLAQKIRDIESGELTRIDDEFPLELDPVVRNVNAMVESERAQRERYRDTLSDLAHSLKTPLTVLRGVLNGSDGVLTLANACTVDTHEGNIQEANLSTINEQIDRMDKIVQYQLKRSVAHQRACVLQRTELIPLLTKIIDALHRVYHTKSIDVDFQVAAEFHDVTVRMEEADLFEIFGNILDNAFKYGRHRVQVRVLGDSLVDASPCSGDGAVRVVITDDGAGIPEADRKRVLARGARLDETVSAAGQGIGLAVVADICHVYRIAFTIESCAALGGAAVSLVLP